MPQMKPMNWILLFTIMNLLLIFMNIMNYFFMLLNKNNNMKKNYYNLNIWKW